MFINTPPATFPPCPTAWAPPDSSAGWPSPHETLSLNPVRTPTGEKSRSKNICSSIVKPPEGDRWPLKYTSVLCSRISLACKTYDCIKMRGRVECVRRERMITTKSYLTHEYIKDPGGDRKRKRGKKDGEEPRWSIHGGMETLGLEVHMELWELLLQGETKRDSEITRWKQ